MLWKTSKDTLIETLREEVVYLRARVESLESQLTDARLKVEEKKLEMDKLPLPRSRPRTEAERCQELTRRSLRRAIARDPKRNLVAEMPPDGAVPKGMIL